MPGIESRYRAAEARVAAAYGLSFTERRFELERPRVQVRALETGRGDPVVFVNGISAPGIGFAPLAGQLAGRRQILLDLPGHGLAPPYRWSGAPLREQAVDVLVGALDALGLERATFIGNSLGGMFTLWLVVAKPERVSDAVIIGEPAVALPGARGSKNMGVTTSPVLGWLAQQLMRIPAPRSAIRKGMVMAIGQTAAEQMSDDLVDVHSLPVRLPGKAASFRSLLRRVLDGRTPRPEVVLTDDELANIRTPLLFVWGEDDGFLSPADGAGSVDKIPTATLKAVPGGHTPWLDDAALCGRLVNEFLTESPRIN